MDLSQRYLLKWLLPVDVTFGLLDLQPNILYYHYYTDKNG